MSFHEVNCSLVEQEDDIVTSLDGAGDDTFDEVRNHEIYESQYFVDVCYSSRVVVGGYPVEVEEKEEFQVNAKGEPAKSNLA